MKTTLIKISLVILAASFVGLFLPSNLSAGSTIYVRISVDQANVRQTASLTAPVIQMAQKGLVFAVLEKSGEWYQIQLPSGVKGFVHQSVVEEVDETGAPPTKPAVPAVAPPTKPERAAARVPAQAENMDTGIQQPGDSFSMILVRAGYFLASDSAFSDIYGNGMVFGGELRIGKKKIIGWLEGTYRGRTGEMSFTLEETKVSVMAVEAGALYRIKTGPFTPYAGLGIGYYMFKETNDIRGEAKQSKAGFCGLAGFSYLLGGSFVLDGRVKYSTCKMKPADFNIEVGGLTAGVGIGIRF